MACSQAFRSARHLALLPLRLALFRTAPYPRFLTKPAATIQGGLFKVINSSHCREDTLSLSVFTYIFTPPTYDLNGPRAPTASTVVTYPQTSRRTKWSIQHPSLWRRLFWQLCLSMRDSIVRVRPLCKLMRRITIV